MKINQHQFLAVVDCGAEKTLCHTDLAPKIFGEDWKNIVQPTDQALRSATGHSMGVVGHVQTTMKFGNAKAEHSVLVCENAPVQYHSY